MSNIGPTPGEVFGQPIGVDHEKPLTKPLTLSWTVTGLTKWQLHSIVLSKWNPAERVWEAQSVPVQVVGNTIRASVRSFSFWDWVANGGQKVGEWTGSRAGPPKCSHDALPDWVKGVVNTDDDSKAAALLTCFEPDKSHPGDVSIKVVNNRTFTQQLVMTSGGHPWAWTWPGEQSYGVSDAVYSVAHATFDTTSSYIVPPLASISLGLARPTTPGPVNIAVTARVNAATVLIDLTSFVVDQGTVGGTDNPLLNAFLEALYECGGHELLDHKKSDSTIDTVRAAISALTGCATDLADPQSEPGKRLTQLTEQAAKQHGISREKIGKAYRAIDELGKAMKVLTLGEVAFYLSDQLANAEVGPLTFSLRGLGTAQTLGQWIPTCQSEKTDANLLYRNLALQDEFSDTSRELWQFADWQSSAVTAVQPLSQCRTTYRSNFANTLPGFWGDKKAAGIVADAIRALDAPPTIATSRPTPPPPVQRSYTPGSSFDDSCVINWPTAPVYTSDSVQMVMGCAHVDESQFFYTQVVYGDPNFRPTPSSGQMHVVGRVIDVATSAYGYKVLEVQASSITF